MKAKRLFISLPLPLGVRADLVSYQEEWSHLPVRWVAEHELHVTLLFLGETPIEMVPEIIDGMEGIAETMGPPMITIDRIRLGPPGKRKSMIWATGSGGEDINKELARELGERGVYRSMSKRYTMHVTMGRIQRGVQPGEEFSAVDVDCHHSFEIDSMELKESELMATGAVHSVMETVSFVDAPS